MNTCWRCNAVVTIDNIAHVGLGCGEGGSAVIHTCTDCDPTPICPELGDFIKLGFRNAGMGLQKAAEYMGCNALRMSTIFRGRAIPSDDEIVRIASKLKVSEEDIRKLI
jgi:hypothetical protein